MSRVTYRALGPVETGSVVNGPAMTPKCLFTVKYYLDCTVLYGYSITVLHRFLACTGTVLDRPHTVQSDTTRCGVSRVGHVAKRPRLYRSDTDFTFTGSNLSRLPLDNNNVAIVKKRKKTKKRKKRKIWGEG